MDASRGNEETRHHQRPKGRQTRSVLGVLFILPCSSFVNRSGRHMEAATLSQSCSGHLPFLCRTSACDVTTGSDLLSFAWTFNRGAKKESGL